MMAGVMAEGGAVDGISIAGSAGDDGSGSGARKIWRGFGTSLSFDYL
jgi:hypothetical protein